MIELTAAWCFVIGTGFFLAGCILNLGRVAGWWA